MRARKSTPARLQPAQSPVSIAERLHRAARRLTGPRRAIWERLAEARHPLSSKEIHQSLRDRDCDPATVYRALHLLEKLELVQRFDLGDGVARFELRRHDGPEHHHHLVCRHCARIIELEECDLTAFERRVARRNGFTDVSHRLEFFGICPACQTRKQPGRQV
jgi:Fur family ferric uptake transcriptional regulator